MAMVTQKILARIASSHKLKVVKISQSQRIAKYNHKTQKKVPAFLPHCRSPRKAMRTSFQNKKLEE